MMAVVVAVSSSGSANGEQLLRRTVKMMGERGISHVAIAANVSIPPIPGAGIISFSERFPLGTAIGEYLRTHPEDRVILVPASLADMSHAGSALESLMREQSSSIFNFAPVSQGSLPIEFPGMESGALIPEQLIRDMQPGISVPSAIVSIASSSLIEARTSSQSLPGLATELMIECYQKGESIGSTSGEITISSSFDGLSISAGDLSRVVRKVLETIPLEEVFPAHPWKTNEQESAAACYHALAAKFIRLGDFQSAESCLGRADQLQDSPRAIALRGLIAMERGETFGAIAKLIASLQEYEEQKRKQPTVMSAKPNENFEQVNDELKNGLNALNVQDNSGALRHFARALREFDSFYRDAGLLLLV